MTTEKMTPVRLQAEASRDQRWSELEERRLDLTRIVLNGPSPSDGPLVMQALRTVCGELMLREADRERLAQMYSPAPSED
jgi:hypothetical protein